jgi:hypothetical protein
VISPTAIADLVRDYAYYVGFHDGVNGLPKHSIPDFQKDYDNGYAIGVVRKEIPEGK